VTLVVRVDPGLIRLCQHVVVRALANQYRVLFALADVARGDSPSEVSRRYGVSKFRLRGWVQRVQEAAGLFGWEVKYLRVLRELLVMRVEPVLLLTRDGMRCAICGTSVTEGKAASHVAGRHKDVVHSLALMLAERVA